MKFQKLGENKLKIILSNNELPNNSNLDDFISDSTKARKVILEILDKAYMEVGFNVKDYKIKIDAVSLYNGSFVFTVTKLIKVPKVRKIAKPKKVTKASKCTYVTYKFENFDDFYNYIFYIKKNHFYNVNLLAKEIELYLYNDKYYLCLYKINDSNEEITKFYNSITEFCRCYSNTNLFISVLRERGKLLIKNNALNIIN